MLVDAQTLLLAPESPAVVAAAGRELGPGRIKTELFASVVELNTGACESAGEAAGRLAELRGAASGFAGDGLRIFAAGSHPLSRPETQEIAQEERYLAFVEYAGVSARRQGVNGLHVHVGMPDGETAVRACNGLRQWVPLLQALGANSPYWYGRDSGLASARSVICNSLPRSGVPRAFDDYADYAATVAELRALGECPDDSYLWWDLRPHPRLGTVEIRALDAQSSLDDLVALVALIHCLAVHEASTPRRGRQPGAEALRELSFRATRDGLNARLMLDGALRPVREVAFHALGIASAYAADLGCWDELMLVHQLLERGNGDARQRANAHEGGIELMLQRLADETVSAVTTLPEAVAAVG
jgi:carboxylate-amine ligase